MQIASSFLESEKSDSSLLAAKINFRLPVFVGLSNIWDKETEKETEKIFNYVKVRLVSNLRYTVLEIFSAKDA